MSEEKQKSGGFRFGTALIWAVGQWAVCWFLFPEMGLWSVGSACFSAFFAGWTSSAMLGRFAKWGANAGVMMVLGVLIGTAVFSGAFSGIATLIDWARHKELKVDWDKLETFFLSWAVIPPAAFGLLSGLYIRMKVPRKKK